MQNKTTLTIEKISADNRSYKLQPLHELMTYANVDVYTKMKSIDECLEQFSKFCIVNIVKDGEAVKHSNLEQTILEITDKPDTIVYNDVNKIISNMQKIVKYCYLKFPEFYTIGKIKVKEILEKSMGSEQSVLIGFRTNEELTLYVKPEVLRIGEEKEDYKKYIKLETAVSLPDIVIGKGLTELEIIPGLPFDEEDILVDVKCVLELVPMDE